MPTSSNCKKFYLRPKKNFSLAVWFCNQPYCFTKIKTTVREVCKEAGLEGKFTNHSLRATCASRMYQTDVPEQLIKEVTGHKSDCVRYYKRTSDNLRESASKTLSKNASKSHVEIVKSVQDEVKDVDSDSDNEEKKDVLSYKQMLLNVAKTKFELRKKKFPKSRLKLK